MFNVTSHGVGELDAHTTSTSHNSLIFNFIVILIVFQK